jgi:hypothetical protein
MPQATPPSRRPAPKRRRSRAIRLSVRPDGAIYGYVVEQIASEPRRERTVEWLGRSPSPERIQRAAKQWGASLPGASTDVE